LVPNMFYKKHSFTLIEIIIVVAIVIVMTATLGLAFTAVSRQRIEVEAQKIVSDLVWAREMAKARRTNFIVRFNLTDNSYTIYRGSVAEVNVVKRQLLGVDLTNLDRPVLGNCIVLGCFWTNFGGTTPQITFNAFSPTIDYYITWPAGTPSMGRLGISYRGNNRRILIYRNTGYIVTAP